MKIVFIHNLYYPIERGGAEGYVRRLAAAASAAGHQPIVITTSPDSSRIGSVDGVKVYYVKSDFARLGQWSAFGRYWWHLNNLAGEGRAAEIARILGGERPDLVITNNLLGIGFAVLVVAGRFSHVHVLHDTQLFYPSGLLYYGHESKADALPFVLYRSMVKRFAKTIKKVVSPSRWLLDWHLQRAIFAEPQKRVLANFSDISVREPHQAHPRFRLLFVGQLEAHKGLKVLIEAFSQLNKKDFGLTVVGDGSLSDWLKSQAIGQSIDYRGRLTAEQVAMLMPQADALIVPSLVWENAPMVLSEAMAAGLPAIGSDFGGIVEIIPDSNLRFCPGDAHDLAEKIKRLKSRYEEHAEIKTIWSSADYLKSLLDFAVDIQK